MVPRQPCECLQALRLEALDLTCDGAFRGQPLDARRAVEANDALGVFEEVPRVFGFRDGPAVANDEASSSSLDPSTLGVDTRAKRLAYWGWLKRLRR